MAAPAAALAEALAAMEAADAAGLAAAPAAEAAHPAGAPAAEAAHPAEAAPAAAEATHAAEAPAEAGPPDGAPLIEDYNEAEHGDDGPGPDELVVQGRLVPQAETGLVPCCPSCPNCCCPAPANGYRRGREASCWRHLWLANGRSAGPGRN